jgi:putative redox protein
MSHPLAATLTLIAGDRFAATTTSGGAVNLATADDDGRPAGAVGPMEGLLVALAGCLGMSVTPFLRRIQPPIIGYEIRARGELSARPPRVFETITIEHIISGSRLDRRAITRAIELAEHRYCGVSAMLAQVARIERSFVFIGEDA